MDTIIAKTVWISHSNIFLIAEQNHMNIPSNQKPQKSRLLPHVNKNDFCTLFSVKILFVIRDDERKGLQKIKKRLFEIFSRYFVV